MAADLKTTLTQNMVMASTEFGIAVVKEIAEQSLLQKPDMPLRDFTRVLDQYVAKARYATNPQG